MVIQRRGCCQTQFLSAMVCSDVADGGLVRCVKDGAMVAGVSGL